MLRICTTKSPSKTVGTQTKRHQPVATSVVCINIHTEVSQAFLMPDRILPHTRNTHASNSQGYYTTNNIVLPTAAPPIPFVSGVLHQQAVSSHYQWLTPAPGRCPYLKLCALLPVNWSIDLGLPILTAHNRLTTGNTANRISLCL